MAIGRCLLTGDEGMLVDAHILPKALTYPGERGMPFAQANHDVAPVKRWSSWYDPTIVTAAGEAILSEIDMHGIAELRRLRLVWSSWDEGEDTLQASDHEPMPVAGWGIRSIEGVDGRAIRLFFMSLLWRAAVSGMVELSEVSLRASEIRRLRRMLLDRDPSPAYLFPFGLAQLSTRGVTHNLAPLRQRKPRNPLRPGDGEIPIFRFYLDGLAAHVHLRSNPREVEELGDLLVGGDRLLVSTVTYDRSWERGNLGELMLEAWTRWPDRMSRIPGFR